MVKNQKTYHIIFMVLLIIIGLFYQLIILKIDFQTYITDKYTNPDAIHHYEITQSSGKTTSLDYSHLIQVNSDATGATSVSNREYEDRINENKRLIKILKPVYLDEYVEEFRRLIQR